MSEAGRARFGALAAHIAGEGARLAALCTACGECVRACPMLPYAPAAAAAEPEHVASGFRAMVRDGGGTEQAISWIAVCTRSGVCGPACPEGIDAAFMMRLATWRAKGAMGEAARIPVKEDPGLAARVKAFARLTMSEEEQAKWL